MRRGAQPDDLGTDLDAAVIFVTRYVADGGANGHANSLRMVLFRLQLLNAASI
jgi:hypothetical protein